MDASGNVTSTGNYPPHGQVPNEFLGEIGLASPLQYSGSYSVGYVGLVYDQARWYDPSSITTRICRATPGRSSTAAATPL